MTQYEQYNEIMSRSVGTLSGIGAKRAAAFARMGIYSIGDLIYHFPRAYQNRGNVRLLRDAVEGENCSFMLTVGTQPKSAMLKNRMTLTKFTAFDESGTVVISYFNSKFLESAFHVGETHRFWGKVTVKGGRYIMSAPVHELALEGFPLAPFTPVYPSVSGLTQGVITDAIGEVLRITEGLPRQPVIPRDFADSLGLLTPSEALRLIHRPETVSDISAARRYFSTEELYVFSLGVKLTGNKKRSGNPPVMEKISLDGFRSALGFPLTGAQERSVNEIMGDMVGASVPMSRLLSGDVGSGKTAVAAAAIFCAAANGFQSALMAPTEILAAQHYGYLSELLGRFGYKTALLLGSTGAAEKRRIKAELDDGTLDLVIGTHALLSTGVGFDRLGLVITDEQHRFGVSQRARLGSENRSGLTPHVLVMSATPIPRTLALIMYGDLDVSMLDELPPGRQRVDTFIVDESYRARLNGFIAKQVAEGGQVYIVCPAVEEKEDDDLEGDLIEFAPDGSAEMHFTKPKLKAATQFADELREQLPGIRIGLVHGKMKGADKESAMRSFAAGETDVLVSTTVIEVGVNVPNASLMIVENAERFGLSQLHQLRGRVGRGSRKAYCVLVSSADTGNSAKRLSVMKNTYDGYKIAEYDLEMRGPGDYFPTKDGAARQHGEFGGAITADIPLLKATMDEAERVLAADPELSTDANAPAKAKLALLFEADARAMQ